MELLYEEKRAYRFRKESNPADFPVHIHNALEVCIMTAGSCRVICENKQYPLQAGDVFISFPNRLHGYEENKNTERYLLILPVKPYLEMFHKTLTEFVPEDPILSAGTWEQLDILPLTRQACKDASQASETIMQGYFAVIVGKLLSLLQLRPQRSDGDNILRSVLLYIHSHYREPVSRTAIARAVGYDESYVSHIFSQVMHMGISRYVNRLRVDDAKSLLSHSEKTVTQIAGELGFGSIRNFNRVFQRETGKRPVEYRKQK